MNGNSNAIKFRKAASGDIAQWLRNILEKGEAGPFEYTRGRDDPVESVIDTFDMFDDERAKEKIILGLTTLYRQVNWQEDSPGFLSNLFFLIGYLNVQKLFNELIRQAMSGELKGIRDINSDADLHLLLLNSLVTLGYNPGLIKLLRRDIHEPQYAHFCYQGLWERDPDNAIKYLPTIIDYLGNEEDTSLLTVLLGDVFYSMTKLNYLAVDFFPRALDVLGTTSRIECFYQAFTSNGYWIKFNDQTDEFYIQDIDRGESSDWYDSGLLHEEFQWVHTLTHNPTYHAWFNDQRIKVEDDSVFSNKLLRRKSGSEK